METVTATPGLPTLYRHISLPATGIHALREMLVRENRLVQGGHESFSNKQVIFLEEFTASGVVLVTDG